MNKMNKSFLWGIRGLLLCLVFVFDDSYAVLSTAGLADNIIQNFQQSASSWADAIEAAAFRIIWQLVAIEMVVKFGTIFLQESGKPDFGSFFGPMILFIVTTGFFSWFIQFGASIGDSFIEGQIQLAQTATGNGFKPTALMDVGFGLVGQVIMNAELTINSFFVVLSSFFVLILLIAMCAEFIIIKCKSWVVLYAGLLNLAGGGSSWTRDLAVNYIRKIWAISLELMTITLLCGVGQQFIQNSQASMSQGIPKWEELLAMFASVLILYPESVFNARSHLSGHSL